MQLSNTASRKSILILLLSIITPSVFSQNVGVIGDSLFSLMEQERNVHEVQSPIFMSDFLCKIAKYQADYIFRTGTISHSNPTIGYRSPTERGETYGLRSGMGENITVFGYGDETDSEISKHILDNFMNSRGHRIRILGDTHHYLDGTYGDYYYGHYIILNKKRKLIIVVQTFLSPYFDSDLELVRNK